MKDYQKQRLSELMRRRADITRCPRCGRRGAMVKHRDAYGHSYTRCQWIDGGRCEATIETDTRLLRGGYDHHQ